MRKCIASFLVIGILAMTLTVPALAANVDTRATAVSGGMSHSIALDKNGNVYTWGKNDQGQLGLGKGVAGKDTPTKVAGLSSITAVAAGYNFSLALRRNGTVVAWGNGVNDTPTEVSGVSGVIAIAAGQIDCLALTAEGTVYQWSMGASPAQVSGLVGIVAIAAGGNHDLALTRTGEVWSWGDNYYGQLGNGTMISSQIPQEISGLKDIVDIAAGVSHSLAVDFSGNVYAWGSNDNCQLGMEGVSSYNRPKQVPIIEDAVQVAAGNGSSMALTLEGKVYTWGYGEYGQLGQGKSEIARATPEQISRMKSDAVDSIACGSYHNLYVKRNGELYVWGRNRDGQLGTGKTENSTTPAQVTTQIMTETAYSSCVLDGASEWARDEIARLYPKGLLPPTMMGEYPSAVTRAELAHLLVTVYETTRSTVSVPKRHPFQDVDDHPLKDSILKAYDLGIISGTSKTAFSPHGQVTRQEAVTMLCRFVGVMKRTNISTNVKNLAYYDDAASIAGWAAPYVDYAYKHDIMKGSGSNFAPLALFTKEQSLLTVARLVNANDWKTK